MRLGFDGKEVDGLDAIHFACHFFVLGGIQMRRMALEATDKNVLQTIENDKLQRTNDIISFVNILESIDYNAFVSIDAGWGNGKSFFVRQTEMTLRYHNKIKFGEQLTQEESDAFDSNTTLRDLELKSIYLPVYYNAWLYDNHVNALLSLVLVAIKQSQRYIDTTLDGSLADKVSSIMDSIQFWKCGSWKELQNSFKDKDILQDAKLLEETRDLVKAVFDEILVEHGQKLVIFVDELDRCKPTFAIEVLESIKHFFDDERIIFVVALNKSQLIHTIKNYYGVGFDSSSYLNRFFDISLQLPECNMDLFMKMLELQKNSNYKLTRIANDIRNSSRLSMRDTAIYLGRIREVETNCSIYGRCTWDLLAVFVPIILFLDMTAVEDKKKVLDGKGEDVLQRIISESEGAKTIIRSLPTRLDASEDAYQKGWVEFIQIYKFVFANASADTWYPGGYDIDSGFKKICLRVCNEI